MVQTEAFGKMAHETTPSPWIERWAALIPRGGAVLDVAAGSGRHSAFLAVRGHPVTAIDRDIAMLSALPHRIRIVQADLEGADPWPLPGMAFAGVVVTNYLHRPLFPALMRALEPGGILLYETFMTGNERYGRPANPDFLLRDGELLDLARDGGLSVVAYEAGAVDEPPRAVMQRIAARRG
jgi:SAM-dependent methyltransferase